jgi:DNA-binding NarL/FixJ family response regulator
MPAAAAAGELGREVDAGRHAPEAVHAVLTAAGQNPARSAGAAAERRPGAGRPAGWRASRQPGEREPKGRPAGMPAGHRPAGLSERECEVLALLARGLATKQVARRLGISPKTCDHHIQRLYGKVGVSTRAGATLFALEHGLVESDETVLR